MDEWMDGRIKKKGINSDRRPDGVRKKSKPTYSFATKL